MINGGGIDMTYEECLKEVEPVIYKVISNFKLKLRTDEEDLYQEACILLFNILQENKDIEYIKAYFKVAFTNLLKTIRVEEHKQLLHITNSDIVENEEGETLSLIDQYSTDVELDVKDEWLENYIRYIREYKRKYYEEHRDELREKGKAWYKEHRKECIERAKKYYEEHKEEYRIYKKRYYEEHREEIREKGKKHYEEHKEEYSKWSKKYAENHREEIRQNNRKYKEAHREEKNRKARESYRRKKLEKVGINNKTP